MRFGLIGDIHAEDERLAAALEIFRTHETDRVLFVGDVADGLGDLDRCCSLLATPNALGVRGNHDRWLLEDTMRGMKNSHARDAIESRSVAFLEALPATRDIATPLGALLLCHGVGDDDMVRLHEDTDGYALQTNDALAALLVANGHALVVGGHTHQRMVRRIRARELAIAGDASLVFVNPGTLARDSVPCCAILDTDASHVRYFELEDPAVPFPSEVVPLP
jgi:predicted phosphodiesterase